MLIIKMHCFSSPVKSLVILLVLIAYIFIPLADSIACNECMNTGPFQGKADIKKYCPICSTTLGTLFSYADMTYFSAISLAHPQIFVSYLEPSFPINKPPQN